MGERIGRLGLGTSLAAGALLLLTAATGEAQRGMATEPSGGGAPQSGLAARAARAPIAAAAAAQAFQLNNVAHVAAGTGMRNLGSGTIRLRGIPVNATVQRAFLYFAMICDGTCPSAVEGDFEGRGVTLDLIGTAANPCWGTGSIAAYKADVTGLMPATAARGGHRIANGDYQLSGFPSGLRTGASPWVGSITRPLAEGATLVVLYRNGSSTTGSRVYIHESVTTVTTPGAIDQTLPLSPAAPSPATPAIFTRFGADGQTGSSPEAFPQTTEEKTFVGGSTATLTQIAGPGATRNLDSDWNGADGAPVTELWDTRTTDVSGLIPGGASSYAVRYIVNLDCITTIGYVLQVGGGGS